MDLKRGKLTVPKNFFVALINFAPKARSLQIERGVRSPSPMVVDKTRRATRTTRRTIPSARRTVTTRTQSTRRSVTTRCAPTRTQKITPSRQCPTSQRRPRRTSWRPGAPWRTSRGAGGSGGTSETPESRFLGEDILDDQLHLSSFTLSRVPESR